MVCEGSHIAAHLGPRNGLCQSQGHQIKRPSLPAIGLAWSTRPRAGQNHPAPWINRAKCPRMVAIKSKLSCCKANTEWRDLDGEGRTPGYWGLVWAWQGALLQWQYPDRPLRCPLSLWLTPRCTAWALSPERPLRNYHLWTLSHVHSILKARTFSSCSPECSGCKRWALHSDLAPQAGGMEVPPSTSQAPRTVSSVWSLRNRQWWLLQWLLVPGLHQNCSGLRAPQVHI